MLPEIGVEGQQRLSDTKAVVIGAGGLGSPVLYYLSSAGVGHIKIIDSDCVDITNLNRQFIHSSHDIGKEKSKSAQEKLEHLNPDIQTCSVTVALNDMNVLQHLMGCTIVLSCVDNRETRYLINSACVHNNIPLIDGGVQGFNGYTLMVLPGITPCYECIFPQKKQQKKTGVVSVLGATAGILGSMMAMEALKHIIGIPVDAYFHYMDLLSNRMTTIKASKDASCPVCSKV